MCYVLNKKLDEMKQIFLMCEELGIRTRVAMNIFPNRVARLEGNATVGLDPAVPYLVATLHRPANVDDPADAAELLPFPDLRMGWGLDVHWAARARWRVCPSRRS